MTTNECVPIYFQFRYLRKSVRVLTSSRNASIQNSFSVAGRRSRCRTWNSASTAGVVIVTASSLIIEI